jgi:hypothetical protein
LSIRYDLPAGESISDGIVAVMEQHYRRVQVDRECGARVSIRPERLGFKGVLVASPQIAMVWFSALVWRPGMQQPVAIQARGRGVFSPNENDAWTAIENALGRPAEMKLDPGDLFVSNAAVAWLLALAHALADFERQAAPILGFTPSPSLARIASSTWDKLWDRDWDPNWPDREP